MELSFKRADSFDVDALLVLMPEFYVIEHLPFDEHVTRAALQQFLADDSLGRIWFIQLGAETIGYIVVTFGFSFEFHGRDALIDEFYIREPYRGRGFGRATLRFIETACRALSIAAVHLEVDHANTRGQALYRKAGFVDHDRYLMTRWLPPRPDDD